MRHGKSTVMTVQEHDWVHIRGEFVSCIVAEHEEKQHPHKCVISARNSVSLDIFIAFGGGAGHLATILLENCKRPARGEES